MVINKICLTILLAVRNFVGVQEIKISLLDEYYYAESV